MNLGTVVRTGVALLGLYAAGCGNWGQQEKPALNHLERTYINSCPDFKVQRFADNHLRVIAGLLAGTMQAQKRIYQETFLDPGCGNCEKTETVEKIVATGGFSEFQFPEIMAKACALADGNKDGVILKDEAEAASRRAMKYFAGKAEKQQ